MRLVWLLATAHNSAARATVITTKLSVTMETVRCIWLPRKQYVTHGIGENKNLENIGLLLWKQYVAYGYQGNSMLHMELV